MEKSVLKNGLTILFDKRESDSVTINILVKVGSNNEPAKIMGVSHFLEHILFEGTKKRTAIELANEIEKVGGYMNASTGHEYTNYYVTVPCRYFDNALDILADMIIDSNFELKVIEKERQVILDEISLSLDEPSSYQWLMFEETLFKKIKGRNPIAGTHKTVSLITREEILDYFNKNYVPNNMIVSVSGNANNVFDKVDKAFGKLKTAKLDREKESEPRDEKPSIKKENRKMTTSYLIIGYKAPKLNDKDSYAMEVIRAILGKGQSSRLFNEIRTKRGLGYAVGAKYDSMVEYGSFAAFVTADKKNIPLCREILLKEYKLAGLSEKEVNESKDYIIGSILIRNELNSERADANAALEMAKISLKSYLEAIKAVKFEEVQKVAKKYFNGGYTEVLIEQR